MASSRGKIQWVILWFPVDLAGQQRLRRDVEQGVRWCQIPPCFRLNTNKEIVTKDGRTKLIEPKKGRNWHRNMGSLVTGPAKLLRPSTPPASTFLPSLPLVLPFTFCIGLRVTLPLSQFNFHHHACTTGDRSSGHFIAYDENDKTRETFSKGALNTLLIFSVLFSLICATTFRTLWTFSPL
jgi:hypothetical protein